ncbi:MAG: hypothetical protein NVS3B6_12330 [Pseudarthrobacter sp.]
MTNFGMTHQLGLQAEKNVRRDGSLTHWPLAVWTMHEGVAASDGTWSSSIGLPGSIEKPLRPWPWSFRQSCSLLL